MAQCSVKEKQKCFFLIIVTCVVRSFLCSNSVIQYEAFPLISISGQFSSLPIFHLQLLHPHPVSPEVISRSGRQMKKRTWTFGFHLEVIRASTLFFRLVWFSCLPEFQNGQLEAKSSMGKKFEIQI